MSAASTGSTTARSWARSHTSRSLGAAATVVLILFGAACTPDREQDKAVREVAAWPLRGNLTGDHALLDEAKKRLDAEVGGQVVGPTSPELQAMDVDDPVKAQPNFKPGLGDDAAAEPEGYRRDNVALGSFVGLVGLGIALWVGAGYFCRRLSAWPSGGRKRWRWMAAAAVVLAAITPLVLWASATVMYTLAYSDPSFDASALFLEFVPALLVGAAAVRCARNGLREALS